jgi:serine/threonine protein kinase/TolB-like protein
MAAASSSDRWRRLEALFHQASELPADARSAFLDVHCTGDTELRSEVEALLKAADTPADDLQHRIFEAARNIVTEPQSRVVTPGARLGSYEITALLGSGGMGDVYLAIDPRLKRRVALKTLRPELTHDIRALRRFENEVHAASALNHPNILTIYEFGESDGLHFIASEFIDGVTLRDKLAGGGLDLASCVDFSLHIAGALEVAHAARIVHRDIKPENIIVRPDGIVKVLDFGIAKLNEELVAESIRRTESVHATSTTQPGLVLGTARYMSPEQARGLAIDSRSDLFSLGTVMYELVSGRSAFNGGTRSDIIAGILKEDPAPLSSICPHVPADLEAIINKAMRKNCDERYQTASELRADLEGLQRDLIFEATLRKAGRESDGRIRNTPVSVSIASWGGLDLLARPGTDTARTAGRGLLTTFNVATTIVLIVMLAVAGLSVRYYHSPAATVAVLPVRVRSLAILPFRNLKQDPQTDFLGFSLADAVISKLGFVSALTVRPSSSVDKYRNQAIDPAKVAADLDVDTLLTGSFIKDGNDLRITTQLIDVKPDKILWQDTIDLKYDKLLTVQDRVAQQIIKGLELNLSATEAQNLKPENPINSLAYEYYLRGVDFYSTNNFLMAIKMLEKSAAMEANYALTWAHLGRAYTTSASLHFGGRDQYREAQSAYEKALALNPALIEPRTYMANLLTDTGRVEDAVPLLRTALQSYPNNAEVHWELGYAYRFGGMLQESLAECEHARQNDPNVKMNSSALNSYLYLGQYTNFLQSLPANDSVYILFYRGFGNYYLRNFPEAARDFDRAYDVDPTLLPADVGKALSDAIAGNSQAGLEILHQTENKIEQTGVSDAEGIYKVAQAYALLGDNPSALRMLRRSIDGGFFPYPYFMNDPLLASLRGQPDFDSLMEQARQRHQQFKTRFF